LKYPYARLTPTKFVVTIMVHGRLKKTRFAFLFEQGFYPCMQ